MADSFFDISPLLGPDPDFDQFAWLQAVAAGFEDKSASDFLAPTASPLSSGLNTHPGLDSDSDNDDDNSDSDSDVDQFPPAACFEKYHVVDGVAYSESTLHANGTIPQQAGAIHPSRRRQTLRKRSRSVININSDDDAAGETDENASDADYVPSPPLPPRKWPSPPFMTSPQSHLNSILPSAHSISTPVTPHRPAKLPRASPPSRNIQTTVLSLPDGYDKKGDQWACPYCSWVQRNKRQPDLNRHVRTHTRSHEPPKWVCNGIPFDDPSFSPEGGSPYGTGGCKKSFSRRDALKRHLDNRNIGCVKRLNPFHAQIGQ